MKDQIDLSDVSDIRPTHCINPEALIVSSGEWNRFKDDCCILVKWKVKSINLIHIIHW